MTNKKYILAHDTGTGGNKAVLCDLQGRVVHSAYQSYGISYPQPEWVEQDPDELWRVVAATTRQVLQESGIDPADVLGVGVSAQMWNTLPVDEKGRPLTQMLSWLDLRSVKQADRLAEGDLPKFLFENTGNIPTAKDTIPKILWLKEERPDIWDRTAYLLDCKEYILFKLTGKIAIDLVGASVYFLFNPSTKQWSQEVCRRLDIPLEKLPPAFPCTEVIGEITEEAARQTGLKPGTPVVICAGDVAVAQTGAGANRAGKVHLCIGTATWVGISTSTFRNHPEKPFWGLNHIDPSKFIIAGEMETGGGALMWFRDTLCQEEKRLAKESGRSSYEMLSGMAEAIPAGSDKLIFLPWLSGERAPVLDHYARGGFIGLNMSHTKGHMVRAVMEGVAYHIRWICEAMEGIGFSINNFNGIGGGCNSPVWMQIISDVTGRELNKVENHLEAGAVGAALTVAVGLGIYPSVEQIDDLVRIEQVVRPDLSRQKRYEAMYREYRELYNVLVPIHRRLYQS
ncbi:MAG TPA: FGGY-family carbohydrate kinase [Anaerolineales bacterium]|nr:FGGY-family carbohydrate kinase [Anaerolineales bacterium]